MSRRWCLSWCMKVTKELFFFVLSLFLWSEKVQIAWSYKHWGSLVFLCSLLQMGLIVESVCSSINKVWKGIVMPEQCPGPRHVLISPLLCAVGCLMLSKPWPDCQTQRPTQSPQVLIYISSNLLLKYVRITHLANKLSEIHPLLTETCFFPRKRLFTETVVKCWNRLSRVVAEIPNLVSIWGDIQTMPLTSTWSALNQLGSWTRGSS